MKTIKDMFNEKINQEDIKKQVIKKVSKKSSFHYWKWGLVPACFILLLSISIMNTVPIKKVQNSNNINTSSSEQKNRTMINTIKWNHPKVKEHAYDIGWDGRKKTLDDFSTDYPWIQNMKIPKGYDLEISEVIYSYNTQKYSGNYLLYRTEESYITVYFSESYEQKPRCLEFYHFEDLEESVINHIKIKLIEVERDDRNDYYAFFKIDDLNLDIEMSHGNKEDFMKMLESIIP